MSVNIIPLPFSFVPDFPIPWPFVTGVLPTHFASYAVTHILGFLVPNYWVFHICLHYMLALSPTKTEHACLQKHPQI